MQRYLPILLIAILSIFACNDNKVGRLLCEEQYIDVSHDTSYLSTPLVIPTRLIEEKLNNVVGQIILNDTDFENVNQNGERDNMKLKITRLGDIQVIWKDNVATYQAPLFIQIEQKLVRNALLPMSNSLALKTEFSLRLEFETTVDIGADWRLLPKTKFKSFKWLSDAKTLGGLLDAKKIVERKLHRKMPQILKRLDGTIREKVQLEQAITRIWKKIQKPILINQKEPLIWFKITPIQFELGTITTEKGNLLIQSRISATTETIVGDKPEYVIDSILPPLIKREALPNTAYIYMLSEISYQDINEIIDRKLAGQVFEISGHEITVSSAEIWGCGAHLVLHLVLNGALNGDIYFQGTPQYDPETHQLIIQNFDFEVVTKQDLVTSADWLLHSNFKEQMETYLTIPLEGKIDKVPNAIMTGIEKGDAGPKMDFIIEQWDFSPRNIWVRSSDIAILIIVNARIRIELEKIGR